MKGEFSEADFIIADPNRPSLLILEVKGGQIEQRDGRWYQNSMPLKLPPLDQAFDFFPHPEQKVVHIGYVGDHLPTTKFPT